MYEDVMAPNAYSATEMYDEYEDDVMNTYNEVINVEPTAQGSGGQSTMTDIRIIQINLSYVFKNDGLQRYHLSMFFFL